jgi:hypothetical protein
MTEPRKPPDPRKFYVVWSPQGGPPVARYPSFGAARTAAVRLSLKLPGQDFFVLGSCWGRIATPAKEPEAAAVEPVPSDAPAIEPEAAPGVLDSDIARPDREV